MPSLPFRLCIALFAASVSMNAPAMIHARANR